MNNILMYKKPAATWNEALAMGNGSLGAMVYGRCDKEIISMNHDTLWSGYPKDDNIEGSSKTFFAAREEVLKGSCDKAQNMLFDNFLSGWSECYLPMADILIDFTDSNDESNYNRVLDLSNAVHTISYICGKTEYKREMFVSNPAQAMVIRLTASEKASISFNLSLTSKVKYTTEAVDGKYVLGGLCPSECPPCYTELPIVYEEEDSKKGMTFSAVCDVKINGGEKTVSKDGICVNNADEVIIYFTAETSFNGYDKHPYTDGKEHLKPALKIINNVMGREYNELLNEHIDDYKSFYDRCSFTLDAENKDNIPTDERLQNYDMGLCELIFNFGRYLLISSSREGTIANNLQGIWNNQLQAPWSSNYTLNINTEMNYWPVLKCGLSELSEPLDDLIYKIFRKGEKTARMHYDSPGFVAHHNSDIWGKTTPVGNTQGPYACIYAYWPMASGWLCRHLFEKYIYTEDINYLRDFAYPIMKSAAEFYLNLLIDYNGELIFLMANSPENRYLKDGKDLSITKSSTMTQSIIYELFDNCIKAADILGYDEDFAKELTEKKNKLKLFEVGSRGELMEWDEEYEEFEPHHRHLSHLYGLYPSELIKYDNKELIDACSRTMELRGDDGTGWSLSWKISLWARLRNAEKAFKLLKMQLNPIIDKSKEDKVNYSGGGGTYINMFDAHPPFQIDGNFGVAAGICEMLVQFDGNRITLLPAVPEEWAGGSVKGLTGPYNTTVDISWKNGKITGYTIKRRERTVVSDKISDFGVTVEI